jgi:hypothetical protein
MSQTPNPTSVQSVLLGDVVRALTLEPRDDSSRRAAMHTLCVAIEGILWMLQRDLLGVADKALSTSQRAILSQKPHILRENGKVGRVPSKVNLKQRMQFSAAIVAALRPGEMQFDEAGWRDLQATLDVRDRLGHPEKPSDLDVTQAELGRSGFSTTYSLRCKPNLEALAETPPTSDPSHGPLPSPHSGRCLAERPRDVTTLQSNSHRNGHDLSQPCIPDFAVDTSGAAGSSSMSAIMPIEVKAAASV